jgi:hypothetical protein
VLERCLAVQCLSINRRTLEWVMARREPTEELLQRLFVERRLRTLEEEFGNALPPNAAAARGVENLLTVWVKEFEPLPICWQLES